MQMSTNKSYCGIIAIVGRPNVGKSSLLNLLVNKKISSTSSKPQTTQSLLRGIYTNGRYQYIFIDSPGLQTKRQGKMINSLNKQVLQATFDTDAVIYVVELGKYTSADLQVLNLIKKQKNIILVINKMDKKIVNSEQFIADIRIMHNFSNIILTSARHNKGIDKILNELQIYMPESPFLYDENQVTDADDSTLVLNIIKEKLFRYLGQELPYTIKVELTDFRTEKNTIIIFANIIYVRKSQKSIIIGKNAVKLKKISTKARLDLEKLYQQKVFLKLAVTSK